MDIQKICKEYSVEHKSLSIIASENKVGRLKIRNILSDNGITIRSANEPRLRKEFKIKDYHIKKYPPINGKHYVAISRKDGKEFNDYENSGGFLTSYIKKELGITIPTLYDRRIYYQTTGNYWWEQWFDIVLRDDKPVKKCPYCEWTTTDLSNKSGMFMTHLKKVHNISIEQYLKEHPEDKDFFHTENAKIVHKEQREIEGNYTICPICGEKFEKITFWHIRHKHNMDYEEFKKRYPNARIMSEKMIKQTKSAASLSNLSVSKERFISKYEEEIQKFLRDNGIIFEPNRQILIGQEIDILIPNKKIGIEFDGLKWHTEWFGKKEHNYHLRKTIDCNEKGYGLIHIFEDEYVTHKDIVLNKLSHILNIPSKKEKAYGRMCTIREIYKKDAEDFLNKYHIQGYSPSSVYFGAFLNEILVGVMSFKNGNVKNRGWELTRFATNSDYNCCGVGGKLFAHFKNIYKPLYVYSFADRRWTVDINKNLYINLGFKIDNIGSPDYSYYNDRVDKYKRFHKMGFSKKILSKKYGFPMTMTETEMAKELGYDRIWNCGLIKYVWKLN